MMFLRCLIFVSLVLSGSSAFSQSQGIPPEILEQIKKIKPKLLQKPYSPKKSDELLKLVHKLTKAERVELSKDGFFVKYRPQFGEISFDGISDSQIAELSEIIPIRTGEDFSRAKLENTARRIKTFYINKGFLQAEVELSTKKSAKNDSYLDLKVKIKQNEPTEIKSILIESNNKLLNKGLEEDLSDFVDESLNDENLENIRKTAVKFLREERYLQATIGETVVELNESATGALIKLPVSRA